MEGQIMGSQSHHRIIPRNGENMVVSTRNDRFFLRDRHWFFHTREGFDAGPFSDKNEAQLALAYFVERAQWPNQKQLQMLVHRSACSGSILHAAID